MEWHRQIWNVKRMNDLALYNTVHSDTSIFMYYMIYIDLLS